MRTANTNKQLMYYAKQGQRIPIYQRDDDENIIYYTDAEGNYFPLTDGEKIGFSTPVKFMANISNKLSEVLIKDFGVDESSNFCQIVADKDYLPIKAGDVIWKKSAIVYDTDNIPNPDSADYVVKGVADEGLMVDLFLLQRVVK